MCTTLTTAATLLSAILLLAGCDLVQETTDPFASTGDGGGVIAFTSMRDGNYEIYLMDATGDNLLKLTEHPALDVSPAWSPDGRKIAFATQRGDYSREIYVMDSDGTNPENVSRFPVSEYNPAWSPNGTRIAFQPGATIP